MDYDTRTSKRRAVLRGGSCSYRNRVIRCVGCGVTIFVKKLADKCWRAHVTLPHGRIERFAQKPLSAMKELISELKKQGVSL